MEKYYPYLSDTDFLKEIDLLPISKQLVKISLLDFQENMIEYIEGEATSGSLNKDGSSAVRRTCSLSCILQAGSYKPEDIQAKYSLNKKIFIEFGIKNSTSQWTDYDIIWMPQGVFYLTSANFSIANTGVLTLSLTLKDKMAGLDGTIGGVIPATTIFDTMTEQDEDGTISEKKVLVYNIIQEAVNHYGGEDLTNIVIDDVPLIAKRLIQWQGTTPLWIYWNKENDNQWGIAREDNLYLKKNTVYQGKRFTAGQNIGYMVEDFVYDSDLTVNAGSTVVQLLQTLADWLGNFEFFYDCYGVFHFREIKNYLNNSKSSYIWDEELDDTDYAYNVSDDLTTYVFNDDNIMTLTNNPGFENIKNDYYILGTTTSSSGATSNIIYHLAIDEKPEITTAGYTGILLYKDPTTSQNVLTIPTIAGSNGLPEVGDSNCIYGVLNDEYVKTKDVIVRDEVLAKEAYNLINEKIKKVVKDLLNTNTGNNYLRALQLCCKAIIEDSYDYTDEEKAEEIKKILWILYVIGEGKNQSDFQAIIEKKSNAKVIKTRLGNMKNGIENWDDKDKQYLYYYYFLNCGGDTIKDTTKLQKPTSVTADLLDISNFAAITEVQAALEDISARITDLSTYSIDKIDIINTIVEDYSDLLENYDSDKIKNTVTLKAKQEAVNQIKFISTKLSLLKTYLEEGQNCLKTFMYCDEMTKNKPSSFYTISQSLTINDTNFYYWDNIWKKVEWIHYYNNGKEGSYNYIDFDDSENYYNILKYGRGENIGIPSMNISSRWYSISNDSLSWSSSYYNGENKKAYVAKDWRTELYLQGLYASYNNGTPNDYYQELKAWWPTTYDLKNQKFYSNITKESYSLKNGTIYVSPSSLTDEEVKVITNYKSRAIIENQSNSDNVIDGSYYLDIITSTELEAYNISNIGKRTKVDSKGENVNCLFPQTPPPYGFIFSDDIDYSEKKTELEQLGCTKIFKVKSSIYQYFATGTKMNNAFEIARYDLLTGTTYQNNITITARPSFYFEPNSRIKIESYSNGISGEYIAKTVGLQLNTGSTMSIQASKAVDQI